MVRGTTDDKGTEAAAVTCAATAAQIVLRPLKQASCFKAGLSLLQLHVGDVPLHEQQVHLLYQPSKQLQRHTETVFESGSHNLVHGDMTVTIKVIHRVSAQVVGGGMAGHPHHRGGPARIAGRGPEAAEVGGTLRALNLQLLIQRLALGCLITDDEARVFADGWPPPLSLVPPES
ncbi:MAG: hypothetical protein FRX49_07803 [Trebouxia sp. A1-2]|nr:MAG: hypothetical protein FRX49_07803 [Trebouxia sp. A1-2]